MTRSKAWSWGRTAAGSSWIGRASASRGVLPEPVQGSPRGCQRTPVRVEKLVEEKVDKTSFDSPYGGLRWPPTRLPRVWRGSRRPLLGESVGQFNSPVDGSDGRCPT